jgi:hypothetical protein
LQSWFGEPTLVLYDFPVYFNSRIYDDEETISGIASFILSTGRNEVNVLPLHHLGSEKHVLAGKSNYRWKSRPIPGSDGLSRVKNWFESRGVKCYVGSDTPF